MVDSDRRPFTSIHRALADPLRIRLLDALSVAPRSAKELATWIGSPPDRLYHHLRQLERSGLVEVAEYRQLPGGKVERIYRRVRIEPPGDDAAPRETALFLGQMLLATRMGIDAACAAQEGGATRELSLTRTGVHLNTAHLSELRNRIAELIDQARDQPDEDGVWTEVLTAIVDQEDRTAATKAAPDKQKNQQKDRQEDEHDEH